MLLFPYIQKMETTAINGFYLFIGVFFNLGNGVHNIIYVLEV